MQEFFGHVCSSAECALLPSTFMAAYLSPRLCTSKKAHSAHWTWDGTMMSKLAQAHAWDTSAPQAIML